MSYADEAKRFEQAHKFPAPPQELMKTLPEWPIPFCGTCCDWHVPGEGHSATETDPDATMVAETANCKIWLDARGFYVTCTNCPYVSKITPAKHIARRWANAHDNGQPDDGRETDRWLWSPVSPSWETGDRGERSLPTE